MYQEEIETQRAKDDQLIDAMRTTITSLEAQIGAERRENQMKSSVDFTLAHLLVVLTKLEINECLEEGTLGYLSKVKINIFS